MTRRLIQEKLVHHCVMCQAIAKRIDVLTFKCPNHGIVSETSVRGYMQRSYAKLDNEEKPKARPQGEFEAIG